MKEEHTGRAIAAMVLGIISVSLWALSAITIYFLFVAGMLIAVTASICGIIAIILGTTSRPLGRAIAGFILGIVGTSLSASSIVIGYLLLLIL